MTSRSLVTTNPAKDYLRNFENRTGPEITLTWAAFTYTTQDYCQGAAQDPNDNPVWTSPFAALFDSPTTVSVSAFTVTIPTNYCSRYETTTSKLVGDETWMKLGVGERRRDRLKETVAGAYVLRNLSAPAGGGGEGVGD